MRFSWGGSCVSRCTLAASVRQLSRCPRVEPAAQAPAKQWYGWQLLLADGTTVAATLLSQSGEVLLAGYLALPPTVAPPSTPPKNRVELRLGHRAVEQDVPVFVVEPAVEHLASDLD